MRSSFPIRVSFIRATVLSRGRLLGVGVLALLVALAGPHVAAQQQPAVPAKAADVDPTLRIGPADRLGIRIRTVGDFTGIRVSNSGKIHVPYIGVVKVYQMTIPELETELTRLFREKGLVKDPSVRVVMEERRSQVAYVLGEVLIPGMFNLKPQMHILDLLALAGGFNEFATPVGFLYRRTPTGDTAPAADNGGAAWKDEVMQVDFEALVRGTDAAADLEVRSGDVLYIPERRKLQYYVVGEVGKPGAFEYPQLGAHVKAAALTVATTPPRVSEVVAKAGGPLRTAKLSEVVLVRFDATGKRSDTPIDLAKLLAGREPDPIVNPNDILFVPGSTAKSLGYSVLRVVPGVMIGSLVF